MLHQLVIRNFALVDELELDLEQGMTVVSGETGAGKSIMLDALALTLGNRADASHLGPHGDRTEIIAHFDVSDNPFAIQWLADHDVDTEDSECILRRVLNKDGRSRAFINGVPTTLADVKALGELLADIHSQHEHQSLLKKDTHRRLLDEFAGAQSIASEVQALSRDYSEKQQRLNELRANTEEQTARAQLLSYQFEELEKLALKPNEVTELETEQKKLANGESILMTCQNAINLCQGDDSDAAVDRVRAAAQLLTNLDQPELKAVLEMVQSAQIQLEEAMQDLEHFCQDFDLDPERLKEVEERLSVIYELSRKHRIDPERLGELQQEIEDELATLSDLDGHTVELEQNIAELRKQYDTAAAKLAKQRASAASKIQTQVSKQLAALGMSGSKFEVALTPRHSDQLPHPLGNEDIEFLISTNPGQPAKSLNKIASGGELSRISLAIQVITANTSQVPCLVFDEVDVGIGGATAEIVGELLRKLGEKAQIICVTHLAQVAAQGHQHLTVAKSSRGKKTTSMVSTINREQRITEIARMLGGVDQTEHSLAHAEAMYKAAQGG
ncbi:MAG: DNA repair protein RecN [Pseudomonadales bacterium]